MFMNMEQILLKGCKGEPYEICKIYNIDQENLNLQLDLLATICRDNGHEINTFRDVREIVLEKCPGLFSQVVELLRLILVLPATNAVSERSFSQMKRLKTCLRTTMTDNRLYHLLMAVVHKDVVAKLDIVQLCNDFVGQDSGRKSMFGNFSEYDVRKTGKMVSVFTQTK